MVNQESPAVHAFWLGVMDYDEAWKLQEQIASDVAAMKRLPALLLMEHPHVYTLGRKAQRTNVLWDDDNLAARGIALRWVDRGGDVTYHGPGQLVGYPILPLARNDWTGGRLPESDFVGYIRRLEKTIISTLAMFGLVSGQRHGFSGVWVPAYVYNRCPRCAPAMRKAPHKIASVGVKVDVNGVSRHGFALNINTDPVFWDGIVPCGLEGVNMVNLVDFCEPVPAMAEIVDRFLDAFAAEFQTRIERQVG